MEKKREYKSESPIVQEVREARKQFWAEYDNDVDRVFEAVREQQEERRRQGYKFADHLVPNWEMPEEIKNRLNKKK
jgi:hypothetical protein